MRVTKWAAFRAAGLVGAGSWALVAWTAAPGPLSDDDFMIGGHMVGGMRFAGYPAISAPHFPTWALLQAASVLVLAVVSLVLARSALSQKWRPVVFGSLAALVAIEPWVLAQLGGGSTHGLGLSTDGVGWPLGPAVILGTLSGGAGVGAVRRFIVGGVREFRARVRHHRRRWGFAFGVLSVVALAAGVSSCGSSSSTPGQVTLTYIAHDFSPRAAMDKKLIAEYEKMHPNVHIKQVVIPYPAFTTKLKAALVANNVDVFADETPLGSYFASGEVTPVDYKAMGYSSLSQLTAKYIPHGLDPFSYHGVPYAIPNEATSYAFYINTASLRAAGISPANYPKTWEDVLALSQKLIKRDSSGRLIRRGFDFAYPATNCYLSPDDEYFPLIAQEGGSIVSADGKHSTFNSAGTLAAYTFIYDWVHTYKVGGPPAPDASDGFLTGTVAMIVSGPWFEPIVKKMAPDVYKNLLVVPYPTFKNAVAPYGPQIDGYGLMVNAHDPPSKQRAAWQFIAWMSHVPVQWVINTGLIIPRVEVYQHEAEIAAHFPFLNVFLAALKRPQLGLYDVRPAAKVSTAIDDGIDRMVSSGQSPKQAVAQASQQIQAALNSGP